MAFFFAVAVGIADIGADFFSFKWFGYFFPG
jgi:hypothetical protein